MNRANPSTNFTIDLARTPREQRRPMALAFGGAMSIAVLYITFCPKTYTSEAKLFVRVGRESVSLDPTATTGQVITLQEACAKTKSTPSTSCSGAGACWKKSSSRWASIPFSNASLAR